MERTLIDRTPPRVQALYHLVLAFCAAALVGCCSSEQARAQQSATSLEASVGTLHLHGGDQLPGQLVAIDNELLVWQSTWFTTPFEFDLSAVSSIDYPVPAKAMKSEQAFRIVTVNNDVLLGNIVELTNEHLVLESPRHDALS